MICTFFAFVLFLPVNASRCECNMGSIVRLILSTPIALAVTVVLFLAIFSQLQPRPFIYDEPQESQDPSIRAGDICQSEKGYNDPWCYSDPKPIDYDPAPRAMPHSAPHGRTEKAVSEKPRPEDLGVPISEVPSRPEPEIESQLKDIHHGLRIGPRYPLACKRKRVEGVVAVEFDVTPQGRIANARVTSAPDRCFRRPMLRYIEKWRYRPLLGADGKYLWRRGIVERFTFTLND